MDFPFRYFLFRFHLMLCRSAAALLAALICGGSTLFPARAGDEPSTPTSSAPVANSPASDEAARNAAEPVLGTFEPTVSTLPLRLPGAPVKRTSNDARISAAKIKLQKFPTYAGYRRLGDLYVQAGLYESAVAAYRTEAAMYRRRGLNDAAQIEEQKAARYETRIHVSMQLAASDAEHRRNFSGARLEPEAGCYIGSFIDRDDQLRHTFRGDTGQLHRYPHEFAELTGKHHATYFTYLQYGRSFPRRWLEMCKREGVIPHIAWEPRSLNVVRDDRYLRGWAAALREYNWPVFIRFAGEMNGAWTPYHGNPLLYRAKFRLVHQVLHRQAPRVATIWCVNSVPVQNIPLYYPGDDGCDWVGVNVYSVPFYDNDPRRNATLDSPLELLDPIYKHYASRKPIAICEYGASHMAAADRVLRNAFAVAKMTQLYSALPRLYPRVKMINWFSCNNLQHARPGRQLNNYNVTEQSTVLQAYRRLIASPYFLGEIQKTESDNGNEKADAGRSTPAADIPSYIPMRSGAKLPTQLHLSIWVKSIALRPLVYVALDGTVLYAAQSSGLQDVRLDLQRFAGTSKTLAVYVYDERKQFITSQSFKVAVD